MLNGKQRSGGPASAGRAVNKVAAMSAAKIVAALVKPCPTAFVLVMMTLLHEETPAGCGC
jgi:hypothetical protein